MIPFLHNAGQNSASGGTVDIGDNIANSIMLDSASSQYLSRTFGTPTSTTIFTLSIWLKRGTLPATQMMLLAANHAISGDHFLRITASNELQVGTGGSNAVTTSNLLRDPAAHMHIVLKWDTTQATAADRCRLYVNGTECSYSATSYPTQNSQWDICSAGAVYLGRYTGASLYYDGYLSQVIFVDGQALTPSSFGRTSADTGQWVNKTYAGTYGNNGFKLDFANSADLGNDVSGNNNDWTTNGGISSANQYTDTPTNSYCVFQPTASYPSRLSAGNLKTISTASWGTVLGTIPVSSGKWYWEVTLTAYGSHAIVGIEKTNTRDYTTSLYIGLDALSWGIFGYSGKAFTNNIETTYGSIFATGNVLGIALDMDNGKFFLAINNTWQNSGDPVAGTNAAFTGLTGTMVPAISNITASTNTDVANFGAKAFTYTPPTGFSALCTANLPTPAIIKPALHFNAKTRTGTGATYSVTGELFAPDLVWTKGRSGATDHALYDSVRGVQKQLESNTTTAESTEATGLTAFNSDGYTAGALAQMNTNAATYIDWMFKGGGTAVSNTSGSITSSVSANTTAGISIVTYTGTGANATVGHGLGVAPKLVIAKNRSIVAAWRIHHTSLSSAANTLYFDTSAQTAAATDWNSTFPTSTVFSLGSNNGINGNGNSCVALCFAEVEGFSKIGSYTGNADANGTFVYCGFEPRWVLVKGSSGTGDWRLYDTARDTYNASGLTIYPNLANGEGDGRPSLDILSNGFKLRLSAYPNNAINFVFIAIAEAPQKYATAR